MSATSPTTPPLAGSALEAGYKTQRDYVLAVLRRRCSWLQPDEREALLHDAYMLLLEKRRAGELDPEQMHPRELRAYLMQTAIYKAMDEGKRAERKRAVPMTEEALAAPDEARTPEDLVAGGLDDARVREVVSELPERRQAIIKLRYFFDRTPAEIQRYLGLSERAYRRELERAMRQVADGIELVHSGNFCDSRRSLILAYVAGIAGPTRVRQARAHLSTCPGCAHWAATLRTGTARVAAAVPTPLLIHDHGDSAGALIGALGQAKDHVVGLAGAVKNNILGVAARVDPSTAGYAAGARPGAVAATLAGCLAVGGGATYCAVEGLPAPVRGLVAQHPVHERPKHNVRVAPRRAAAATTVSSAAAPATTTTATHATPPRTTVHKTSTVKPTSRAAQRAARQRREAAAVGRELDPVGTPQSSTAQQTSSSPPRRSAPTSTKPGEFDP